MEFSKSIFKRNLLNSILFSGILIVNTLNAQESTTKNQDNISEIRVEEVHDHEDGKHFYRVYFHYKNGKIKIMGESKTKPILARYVSKIY